MNKDPFNKPLVSVILVTYNQKMYIGKAIESILMQECGFDFELLIGDDASTDGTLEICRHYRDENPQRIQLHANAENKGFLNNYFDLLSKARGTYLADCGGDDYWLDPKKLDKQVGFLESHPNYGMATGNWLILNESDQSQEYPKSHVAEGWDDALMTGKEAVVHYIHGNRIPKVLLAAACFRKDWVMEAYQKRMDLFRGQFATCEDLPITLSLLIKGPIYVFPDTFAVYRLLKNSVSHSENTTEWIQAFYFRTYQQTCLLALHYQIPTQRIASYIQSQSNNFALHAFLSNSSSFMDQLLDFHQKSQLPIGFKMRYFHRLIHFPSGIQKALRYFLSKYYESK